MFIDYNPEEVTDGGIIIPEKSQGKMIPSRGKVFIAGPECRQVRGGDTVMFCKDDIGRDSKKIDDVSFVETIGELFTLSST